MAKTKTKREFYGELLEIVKGNEELTNFINHELELLDKKSASHTQTKTQKENESIKETIVETLKGFDKKVTIQELQESNPELAELSNQKISALLTQLVNAKVINKDYDKKKAYFGM